VSVKVMSLVWDWSLPATEKLVALKLADCANDEGRNSYPAVATIAADCGLTRRGTQKVLERLVAKGCIEVQASHTNRRSTTYRVMLNAQLGGEPRSPLEVNDVRPSEVNDVPVEANDVRPRGEPRSPLEVNDVRPIRPRSVLDPSENTGAREDARRAHPLDERPSVVLSPQSLALFDELWTVYPRQDARLAAMRAWHALDPPQELGAFIVAHVRMRVAAGWARETPWKFLPQLRTFLEERRWQERFTPVQTSAQARTGPADGLLVMRSCPACGDTLEGRVVNGDQVFPPCSKCAPSERGKVHA
jgi:hypothetical protein